MKVLILALDALEYDLVKKYKLKNIMQKEYGKVRVPLDKKVKVPYTQTVWASFITGLPPEKHGIVSRIKYKSPLIEFGRKYIRSQKLGKVVRSVGFKATKIDKSVTKNFDNIFDNKKSIAISIPTYNENPRNKKLGKMVHGALGKDAVYKKSDVEKKIWELYRERKKLFFNKIKQDWNLLMIHIFAPDLIQHLLFMKPDRIKKMYLEMEDLVKQTKKKMPKDCLLLIVSDHGQKMGIHTNHGFYSSNMKLGLKNPDIKGFKKIIEDRLRE